MYPDVKARLIATSVDKQIEFYKVHLENGSEEVYRVRRGWVADIHGNPMGMRWECTFRHWVEMFRPIQNWIVDVE